MRRNIWVATLYSALRGFLVAIPIIVPFFLDAGLNMTQVFTLQAAFSATMVLLEVPSGYISDTLGRRRTLIMAAWLILAGWLLYALGASFWPLLAAEVVVGIGVSLYSGTDKAILYDTLVELGESERYSRIEGRRQALARLTEGVSAVLGGLLASVFLRLPIIVQAASVVPIVVLAYLLVEPRVQRYAATRGHVHAIIDVARSAFATPRLASLVIYSAIVACTTLTAVWLLQPYFESAGLPLAWYGVVWGSMYIVASGAGFGAHRIDEALGPSKVLGLLMLLPFVASLLLGLKASLWLLVLIPIYQIVRTLQDVSVSDYLNRLIPSERRASIISTRNLLSRLLFIIVGPLVGFIVDTVSLQAAFLATAFGFLAASIAAYAVLRNAHKA